jgi:hypothetical protein
MAYEPGLDIVDSTRVYGGMQSDTRAMSNSMSQCGRCRCLDSLDKRHRSGHKCLAARPHSGPCFFTSSILHFWHGISCPSRNLYGLSRRGFSQFGVFVEIINVPMIQTYQLLTINTRAPQAFPYNARTTILIVIRRHIGKLERKSIAGFFGIVSPIWSSTN